MDLADARRLKELETILAESLLKNRVLEAVNAKKMVGSDLKSATPFDTRELRCSKMVEAAGIEPTSHRRQIMHPPCKCIALQCVPSPPEQHHCRRIAGGLHLYAKRQCHIYAKRSGCRRRYLAQTIG
jgi:hypothetical protein|tara:strand:- start:213 stop:593 length:381 start_codon:yes stop_codon:yes gene_type:complete